MAEMMGETWALPSSLQLIKGSPINCLIVEWATGSENDAAQQAALKPLIRGGRDQGISFVGRVSAKQNVAAAVTAGKAAGLEAVMLDAPVSESLDLPVILQFPQDSVKWESATDIFSTTGNVWPGMQLKTMEGDKANAGPTSAPWVNSNGWFAMLARQMVKGKTLWLDFDPPELPTAVPEDAYCLAIADSWAYGARWVITLDDRMRAALLMKDQVAEIAWNRMRGTLAYFESHREWESYRPMGALAVVSDFSGQSGFMSGEVLNLLNRRQVQFVILDRPHAFAGPVEGLKGVLWLDDDAPSPEQHQQLLSFVEQGGLVIAGKYWGPSGVTPHKEDWLFGYEVYNVQKGRIVVADGGFSDPYQLAGDAHLLVSRSNDVARLYNPGTSNCYVCIDPTGHKQVVQVLNYSRSVADYMTLWVNTKAREAQLWNPRLKAPSPMQCVPANEGTEFDLPPLFVACAVEFERLV
jgi:hypothetical protein